MLLDKWLEDVLNIAGSSIAAVSGSASVVCVEARLPVLWVVGNAFASGWSNPLPSPFDVSQKFTKVSDTQYELVVDMLSTGNYKLIQEQGVWGTQYKKLAGDASSGTFEKKDADPGFDAPAVAGKYKLVFDFQAGTYTVTKQ